MFFHNKKYSKMIVKFLSVTSILLVNYVVKTSVSSPSLKQVDRSLHVRSLPPINGIQSNIYEVYMEPYGFVSAFI